MAEDDFFRLFAEHEESYFFGNSSGVVSRPVNQIQLPEGSMGQTFLIHHNHPNLEVEYNPGHEVGPPLYYTGIMFYDKNQRKVLLCKRPTDAAIDLIYRLQHRRPGLTEDLQIAPYDLMSNSELQRFQGLAGTEASLKEIYKLPFKNEDDKAVIVNDDHLRQLQERAGNELMRRQNSNSPDRHNWSIPKRRNLLPGYRTAEAKPDYSVLGYAIHEAKSALNLDSRPRTPRVIGQARQLLATLEGLKRSNINQVQWFDSNLREVNEELHHGKIRAFLVAVQMEDHPIITADYRDRHFEWVPREELQSKLTTSMFEEFQRALPDF